MRWQKDRIPMKTHLSGKVSQPHQIQMSAASYTKHQKVAHVVLQDWLQERLVVSISECSYSVHANKDLNDTVDMHNDIKQATVPRKIVMTRLHVACFGENYMHFKILCSLVYKV